MQNIVEALLAPNIKALVPKILSLDTNSIYPVSNTLPIFLRWVDSDTVNLEFIEKILSPRMKESWDSNLRRFVRTGELVGFYKVLGVYDRNMELTILNEYVDEINDLKNKGQLSQGLTFRVMSLEDNAMIAALSMETVLEAMNFKDKSLISNGIELDLLMTFDNEYLQAHLDDKYDLPGVLCAYQKVFGDEDDISLNPAIEHKLRFDILARKCLLTAYNRI